MSALTPSRALWSGTLQNLASQVKRRANQAEIQRGAGIKTKFLATFFLLLSGTLRASCLYSVVITAKVLSVSKKYVEISSLIGPSVRVLRSDIETIYFPPSLKHEPQRKFIFKIKTSLLGYKCDSDESFTNERTFKYDFKKESSVDLPAVRRKLKEFFGKFF